jgi:glutamine synthetase
MTTTQATPAPPLSIDEVSEYATVIVASPDVQGRLFGKRMAPDTFLRSIERGISFSSCALAWDIEQSPGIELAYTGFHTGWHDILLRPDLSTLRPLAWMDGVAFCMGDVVEVESGELAPISPRAMLGRAVRRLRDAGFDPIVASELEFFLFEGGYDGARTASFRGLEPTTHHRSDYAIEQSNAQEPFLRELRDGLAASGVRVGLAQSEWGFGQWEINLEHGDPVEIADSHLLLKLATKDLARRHGKAATFMAWPSEDDEVGSSCHLHCSLRDAEGQPLLHDGAAEDRLSSAMRHAVGGTIANAPDFMAWYAPTINAYCRANRPSFAGHGLSWGYDNRTLSCRTIADSADSARLEWRVPGADVNVCLAMAALLASVGDGLERGTDPGPPTLGNAYEQEVEPLPSNLAEAAARLRANGVARDWFGELAVDHHVAFAEFEWAQFMGALTDWELRRYFELI